MSTGDDALEHETRRMIFDHIQAYPGVSYSVLKRVFRLTDGTLRYHLYYLERAEKIKFSLEKGKRFYYPQYNGISCSAVSPETLKPFDLTPIQVRILTAIKQAPGISQKELINKTGLKRYTIVNNLKKLLKLDIVRKTPNGRNVFYEYITNEQLRYEILRGLVIKLLKKEIDEDTFLELKRKLEKA